MRFFLRHRYTAAIAVIGIAVADDRFIQPQPGTSAADHLASGLIPLAALLFAAWWIPRAQNSSKGWIALAVGLFGLAVGGGEAGFYALAADGPSGDDYTGFGALAAGLGLVAGAVIVLWRTRRLDDRRVWRYPRRALIAVAIFMVAMPIGAAYVYGHNAKTGIAGAKLTVPSQHVRFDTDDGVSLDGRWIPSRNGAAVVVYPGRAEQVKMLADAGYGVVVFTRRGEGASDGDPQRWTLSRDIRGAVAFAARQHGVNGGRVGGIGFSVGGESMLQAGAETTDLRAIVSEGAGARTAKESIHFARASKWVGVGGDVLYTAASALFSDQLPPVDLLDDAGRIGNRPVFLIHSSGGGLGGEELNPQYYDALTGPKTIWDIPESSHTGGFAARPKDYERRVLGFFDRALRAPDSRDAS